ncbi:MAG: hypothetical protein ABRQ38_05085 [Candidatus Eremiobacterota bacterium]
MRRTIWITLLVSLVVIGFIAQANAAPSFVKSQTIKIPKGFVATKFNAQFSVASGKSGLAFYMWDWKIVNSDGSTVYRYRDANPPMQSGPLSKLVLAPGTYYVYVNKGSNLRVTLKINYEVIDNSIGRYAIPAGHAGYTVHDFDREEVLFFSGDCGYFKVKDNSRPYYFVETPSYINLDNRTEPLYFATPDNYYIFDGGDGIPILYDKDDKVVIVDNGDKKLIIVEHDGF